MLFICVTYIAYKIKMINIADKLINNIIKTKNPTVVGLDPDLSKIPLCYLKGNFEGNKLEKVAGAIYEYNKDIIDTVFEYVPAVKPQMAFYEKYGSFGVRAFEKTVKYALEKGLVVIEDGKRNDIGNTALAYAKGHLGKVETLDNELIESFNVDFLTISPFLGSESLEPFINECVKSNKGVFILVKTSNKSAGEIQDVVMNNEKTVSENLACYVNDKANCFYGEYGYSSIGAVVGATYPEDAKALRKLMPRSFFLVPGYGVQGGSALDIVACFNSDGLGAIVNSSRGILYSHLSKYEKENITKREYLQKVLKETKKMQKDIYACLLENCKDILY
ncbi:MAG: orotidine-5'-phosphate decarboxylase [Bacilli bacterium]|nr:orotidine-5'-phosphate decarboxylase [Bacilli bacterium]